MNGKRILLIIGGGIAAYKALELIRRLRDRGASVRCVLTEGGAQFVTPLSVAALSEQPVYTDLFSLKDETEMGHIQLSREADLLLVCPATADLIAKMAVGLAGDLASTVLLATDKPVAIVPAMNVRMWQHPATRRNVACLRADGVAVMEPTEGPMACGEYGPGRLPDVPDIVNWVAAQLEDAPRPLAGHKILVTAGPTHEPIDPVRYIANRSSGKQGYAVAEALAKLGAQVTLVSGPTSLPTPAGVTRVDVETAREMAAACQSALPVDAAVCVAAVADWRVEESPQKIKKDASGTPALTFIENPDILAALSRPGENRPRLVVGFAAETENVIQHAKAKIARKGCDWIVANDVSPASGVAGGVMGGDRNAVHIITPTQVESWPEAAKADVATLLAERIAHALAQPR
ncbi:bifunctional phosphopantothenoylcysteine decarboxylase/phosphopantothenate--cysteine ligase CoaBC [Pedomonas mirosovicensis]|uniref:bifunctional phosphopantothenoylcysteine decarboxylase/phosphopantothenate--cysteine ligase CoaBC n=1 Tax=Pedomonas mirosovicensis TaxID=2908641 RepID=UPI002168BDF5|nr:bifunctional phosphopantothenoylcysteine decarboxylase/phosphopantothenate--cysteine ligase CoaBC [Pedomonas mirosovicensis]MCH8683910.1 bifunctional phosphopantothenoylcysteine decarboxylase/phosphopantothenate--cysteine ligase CoaBC [Pedomonas mirosovicensis]